MTAEEKRPKYIAEPKPGPTHVICAVCREKFADYYEHIFSVRHQRGVVDNKATFALIDDAIVDIASSRAEKGLRLQA